MNTCKDCRHASLDGTVPVCRHELAKDPYYDGEIYFKTCAWMRSSKGYCGIDGDLLEPCPSWRQRLLSLFRGS